MAEAVAVVGIVASIGSLIDLGAKVATRLHEFASQTAEVPESFRALSTRLPLLNSSLQAISAQAQAGRLSQDVVVALHNVISNTFQQVTSLQTYLSHVLPPTDASRLQRAVKALKSLAKEKEVQAAVEKIHHDIDFLVLHQTTRHVDTGERILEELVRLQLVSASSPTNIPADSKPEKVVSLGLCLSSAPQIEPGNFVGRAGELDHMQCILLPGAASTEQRNLVLGGIGGIGKTQLAIAYARRHRHAYSSVLWLNATSESTLKASWRLVMQGLVEAGELEQLSDEQVLARAQGWLAATCNTQWLLIFDNHDEPEGYAIEAYYPQAGHGSIVVTTRLPELVSGQQIRVQPLQKIEESLDILQARSGRGVKDDTGAKRLAERLGGLPLALVTAGAYMAKSTMTFEQYLEAYGQRWNLDPRRPLRLKEYQDRTLYTTWNLSYRQLEQDDPDAARMLQLLAYFDSQEIWYALLRAGVKEGLPAWLELTLTNQISFESVMRTLVEYCLVEMQAGRQSYSIHSCVHDWTLGELNRVIDLQLYWYAFDCVAASISEDDWEVLGHVQYARLSHHGARLTHTRFEQFDGTQDSFEDNLSERLVEAEWIAEMLRKQIQLFAAEQMYLHVLVGKEKTLGPEHTSTLETIHNLGLLYREQDKQDEAEQMLKRALAGHEKVLGAEHTSTLSTVNSLGILYQKQDKRDEAEQMMKRALAGYEKILGTEHTSTLITVNNLGLLYRAQNKQDEAERMMKRALAGKEKALGPEHISTLATINNLGVLYRTQNKQNEAEQMLKRALAGKEKILGLEHTSTLATINNLGLLYADQGKLDEAERLYERVLAGREKVLGVNHTSTLETVHNLGNLYTDQNKLDKAEQMYVRALAGYENALTPDHSRTVAVARNLIDCRRLRDSRVNEAYSEAGTDYEI